MNKKVIIILANILISMILIFIFADPLWSSVKILKFDLNKQNQEIEKIEQLLIKVQELEGKYQEVGMEDIQDITSALPKEKDLPYLMNQFETLAANNGLLFESLKFSEEIERSKKDNLSSQGISSQPKAVLSAFPYLPIKIELSGSYDGFKSYLDDLENGVRLMDVREINFKSEQAREGIDLSGLSIFKFTLGLIIYYQ